MSSPSSLPCPTCLHVTPAMVPLPCGHSFCLPCLQTMDQGLDRHSCPQCRQEYRPHYYYCAGDCSEDCNTPCSGKEEDAGTMRGTGKICQTDDGLQSKASYLPSCGTENPTASQQNNGSAEMQAEDDQGSAGLQNMTPMSDRSEKENEAGYFQNKTGLLEASGLKVSEVDEEIVRGKDEMRQGNRESLEKNEFHDEMPQTSSDLKSEQYYFPDVNQQKSQENSETNETALDIRANSVYSELHEYLKSIIVEANYDLAGKEAENIGEEPDEADSCHESVPKLEVEENLDKYQGNDAQNGMTTSEEIEEVGMRSPERPAAPNKNPPSEENQREMAELKSKLTLQVEDLSVELEKAESCLNKEEEYKLNVTTANAKLRENALKLLADVVGFAQNFSTRVMELIEQEVGPGEEEVCSRVADASKRAEHMKQAKEDAESLLKEEDLFILTSKIHSTMSEIERCKEEKQPDKSQGVQFNLAKRCPELERLCCEFREEFGQVQRSLRSVFNPSEVTFDPDTLHPNLVLSEDMKTVKFSAKKQEYPPSSKRFTTFFQVLSTQSFSSGVHRWEVELEGAPWMLGVCSASVLPRCGLPSALESCPSSWVLMWNSNLLTALERGRTVSVKKTSAVARTLRVQLDLDKRQLSFYHLPLSGQSSLVYSFSLDTQEPLQLAYRMLSGDLRGRVTIRT